jgi:hypothetical protein
MVAASGPVPTRFVAYWSTLDVLVPGSRARIVEPELRAANVCIPDEGHLSILLSRRLVGSVLHELGAAEGLPGYGTPLAGFGTLRSDTRDPIEGVSPCAQPARESPMNSQG